MTCTRSAVTRSAAAGLLACGVGLVSACSGSPPAHPVGQPSSISSSTTRADPGSPQGLIAIGHSGMTGLSSDLDRLQENSPANSWATGSSPAVNSVYLRMLTARPKTEGRVANAAKNGAEASTLTDQAREALAQVPTPALVLVQTLDNDIRCDGTDTTHYPEFGAQVRAAVELIAAASPKSEILIVSQFGRPATYAKAVAADPVASRGFTSDDPCSVFAGEGKVNAKGVATLTSIIEAYEAEQARACAGVPLCHTDEGAMTRFQDRLEDYGPDRNHLLASGHARLAETIWPTVAKILGMS